MKKWDARPAEVAYLLNPAFCGAILREFVKSYSGPDALEVAYPLLYLVLPIVLHRETRELLPTTSATQMHVWLQAHPHLRIQFAYRTRELVPFTKEALIVLLQQSLVVIDENGRVLPGTGKYKRGSSVAILKELDEYLRAASLVGKWFRVMGAVSTIYAIWGVCP